MSSEGGVRVSDSSGGLVQATGAALRRLRKTEGLTQAALAARLQSRGLRGGSSSKTVSAWENGDTPIPLTAFPILADCFQLDTAALVRRLGLCGDVTSRDILLAEGVDLLRQLSDEPPEIAGTILTWIRQSVEMARLTRLGRTD